MHNIKKKGHSASPFRVLVLMNTWNKNAYASWKYREME